MISPTLVLIDLRFIAAAFIIAVACGLTVGIYAIRLSIVNRRLRDQRDFATAMWNATRQREQQPTRLEKKLAPFTVEMQAAAVRYDDETRLDYRPRPEFEQDMADLTAGLTAEIGGTS